MITRRHFMQATSTTVALSPWLRALADEPQTPWRIGACDWSIGQRQQIEAFDVAKQIGLDGVQFSFGEVGAPYDLRKPEARQAIERKSQATGVAVCSLAMGVLNRRPYATDDEAAQWVSECIDVMRIMGQKILLLAFFSKGDINGDRELQDAVISRLKKVAPKAKQAGVVLGLETWLNVEDHLRILDAVDSPAVQVYYDTANMHKRGHDIYADIRRLKGRICQVHCKENGALLGKGKIDFAKVRDALAAIDYRDWLVIESARPGNMPIVEAYRHNAAHLRKTFNQPAARQKTDWQPLFNGKDLAGWHTSPGGKWEVVDGKIVGTSPKSERRHGLLISDQSYGDFDVRLKFRVHEGNSGFYFRSKPVDHAVGIKGFQAEVDRTMNTGGLYETRGRAWVAKPDQQVMKQVYTPGAWTAMRVETRGKDVTVYINDKQVTALRDDPGLTEGHFALQLHGGQNMHVEFKDLAIRPR